MLKGQVFFGLFKSLHFYRKQTSEVQQELRCKQLLIRELHLRKRKDLAVYLCHHVSILIAC